ncbi:hypothetical protein [Thorsellia anophelis]|nr:hypothetical protein [Thorsellia anophelis]
MLLISLGLILSVCEIHAIPISANSSKTKPVQGHPPYMYSIAARLDIEKNPAFTESGEPILTAGSIVYIPSEICNIPTISLEIGVIPTDERLFYYFYDQDRDDCIGLEHEIEWYMLENNDKPL